VRCSKNCTCLKGDLLYFNFHESDVHRIKDQCAKNHLTRCKVGLLTPRHLFGPKLINHAVLFPIAYVPTQAHATIEIASLTQRIRICFQMYDDQHVIHQTWEHQSTINNITDAAAHFY